MLRIITSLSFLYAFVITVLLVYGLFYYRDFVRSSWRHKKFPFVFGLISAGCVAFLWVNIHATLKLETFSSPDHHFIRQDGFLIKKNIELGRSDTVNFNGNSFNSFVLTKKNGQVTIHSGYSEDPFYSGTGDKFQLVSVTYPAPGHSVSFDYDTVSATIKAGTEDGFELSLNGHLYKTGMKIRKGSSLWNILKEENSFINSGYYTDEKLSACLRHIMVVRNDVSRKEGGELKFFISGRIFQYGKNISYDQRPVRASDLQFKSIIADKSLVGWGIGFLDNSKNQFRVSYSGNDSFLVINRYPVSYPLTEEHNNDWSEHGVTKFLLSDSKDMLNMAAVFREGFLFPSFEQDSSMNFSPVLLSYQKSPGNQPVRLSARWVNQPSLFAGIDNDKLVLPARSGNFNWIFSIHNTFDWEFGNNTMAWGVWQWLLFGSLGFFIALIFFTSLVTPAEQLSWVWQLLSSVTIVLLTTRFFLYWRYKSFPPYEGMDLPSLQQLNSFWNFGIIVFAAMVLAIIFGFRFIRYAGTFLRTQSALLLKKDWKKPAAISLPVYERISGFLKNSAWIKRYGAGAIFFSVWLMILAIASGLAFIQHFDPGTCRHLAIGLMVLYFIFVIVSYQRSPLVAAAEKSWWRIHTAKKADLLINNPVKVLLSISLLAVFVFIDIGFAIVFLNFLLFHEAFLCINYAIGGLSAGNRRNATLFGVSGLIYLLLFTVNLWFAPYIFRWLLNLPQSFYLAAYILFAIALSYNLLRLFTSMAPGRKRQTGAVITVALFLITFFFFPKERILEKAAMTKYRIDVLTMPVDKAIESAYTEGKTYEPVIRAAQNQWFINTLTYEKNNPAVQSVGFHLLPHAPQNKGAKYNAQATDLVASRFFLAEHGKWSVLLYVLLLILPTTMLASFYKLYPDFTNRTNRTYPAIIAGFSILNYLLISALLVILAATGRYIFFGQDLPFGSILSKQSILFPSVLIITVILLFRDISPEYYSNRKKIIPGFAVFVVLALLLFFFKPGFNKNKEFNAGDLAKNLDNFIQLHLQPLLDNFDTARSTRRYSMAKKDQLFTDSVRRMIASGDFDGENKFFTNELGKYTRKNFPGHLDESSMLYLDLYSGKPQLAVNENYFRVEPPPHLQQSWTGNVLGDSTLYNIVLWDGNNGSMIRKRVTGFTGEPDTRLNDKLSLSFRLPASGNIYKDLYLVNKGASLLTLQCSTKQLILKPNDSIKLFNPSRIVICDPGMEQGKVLIVEPDAYMENYYVNGSRFYVYPLGNRFTWARNFAESIASGYAAGKESSANAFVSFDFGLMDSLTSGIQGMMKKDTAYKKGAEYGICVADGNGRFIAMADFIKDMVRPDPNNKAEFAKALTGENGFIAQSLLRKQIGNINLLRLNPGPGSTFKPIVFSAIASQLDMDWDAFVSEGFSEPQRYYGGERVAEYDFEKNNGRINNVIDYLKYSDNYYHSNVLLLGSYPKQDPDKLLSSAFVQRNPGTGLHWPYFTYHETQYWLNGFKNWPGYADGQVNFGLDSSFTSIGLNSNYGIYTHAAGKSFDMFTSSYDSSLFLDAYKKSGFILPEYSLFDQQGANVNRKIPYDVFASCLRGHVKGSSQVMVTPAKMVEAFGKMISQNRNYALTLNPYATGHEFSPFAVDHSIAYNNYLSLMRESVFAGMKEVLRSGTAAGLGALLKSKSSYYYYAKTGTTGDNEAKTKSKLLAIVISQKDISDPGFNFRDNKFYTIYFTLQNGPAKQNEQFEAEIIKYIEQSHAFNVYMNRKD
ncbi:MAG: hypothetical protein Q8941_03090 [Bacteroidota bacterium]|nr:hypothetical protein [Bacteroidota bacterium]